MRWQQNTYGDIVEKNLKHEQTEENKKIEVNFMDYYIYESERRQIYAAELSPCANLFCICDSCGNAYIYKIIDYAFLYLFKITTYYASPISSVLWIAKKKKKHNLYKNSEFTDYLLGFAFINGSILFYDLTTKCVVEKITCSSSITKCKLNNSLEFFGFTELSGCFRYYSLYKNRDNILYNCYDKFYSSSENDKNEADKEEETRINIVNEFVRYKRMRNGSMKYHEIIHEEDNMENTDFENENLLWERNEEEKEKKETPLKFDRLENITTENHTNIEKVKQDFEEDEIAFDIVEKIKLECNEKLVCFYFMDILKNIDDIITENKLAKKWQKWMGKWEKEKRKKKNETEIDKDKKDKDKNKDKDEAFDDNDNNAYKKKKKWDKKKIEEKLNKKIDKIQRSFNNYKHYVLLGTDKSKIYKFCLHQNVCVAEFKSINKDIIIWDVVYIYRTNEVACVDNTGSIIIFDNDTTVMKYISQGHKYKGVSIVKGFNERCLFTAGIDRFINKYILQRIVSGANNRFSYNSHNTNVKPLNYISENNIENNAFSYLSESNKLQPLYEKFYMYAFYKERNANTQWIFFNKCSVHIADIKRIINVSDKYILSISDDLRFGLTFSKRFNRNYYYVTDVPNDKHIHFSEDMQTMVCSYSSRIRIHKKVDEKDVEMNNALINTKQVKSDTLSYIRSLLGIEEIKHDSNAILKKKKEIGKNEIEKNEIEKKEIEKNENIFMENAKAYKHKANINYKKGNHINIVRFNKKANIIGCLTNRQFCIYSCELEEAMVYNIDLKNLNFCKIYDFCFVDETVILVSLIGIEETTDDINENKKNKKKHTYENQVVEEGKKENGTDENDLNKDINFNGFINVTQFFQKQKKTKKKQKQGSINAILNTNKNDMDEYVKHFGIKDFDIIMNESKNEEIENEESIEANFMQRHIKQNVKFLKKRVGFYLVLYDLTKKNIKEKRKMKTCIHNFVVDKKGVIVCSDYYKNIYVLFKKDQDTYLKNILMLRNCNIYEKNINRTIFFYSIVEDMLFLFGAKNSVYIFMLDMNKGTLIFLKKLTMWIPDYLYKIQEMFFLNLSQNEHNHNTNEKINKTNKRMLEIPIQKSNNILQKEKIVNKSETEIEIKPPMFHQLNNVYCLICKTHMAVYVINVNIDGNKELPERKRLFFNTDKVTNKKKKFVSVNTYDQLYFTLFEKTETLYFTKKQMLLRNIDFFSKIENALKTGITEELIQMLETHKNNIAEEKGNNKIEYIKKNIYADIFNFNLLLRLPVQYAIDLACGYDKRGNPYVLVCLPKKKHDHIIPMANTKKYKN